MNDKILFSNLIDNNLTEIKNNMLWDNYDLNDTIIVVTEKVKDDAIKVLKRSYGKSLVYADILDEFLSDVFIYFPVLLQQLSITRLIDAYGVVKDDIDSVETIRTENMSTEVDQNSILTQGTAQNDTSSVDTQNKTTGTVAISDMSNNTQTSNTTIQNNSGIESTGGRNVTLSHNMPEQALSNTGNFPSDDEGTPILATSFVQQAQEAFSTSNPVITSENSEQNITNTDNSESDNITTNDITVSNTGSNSRSIVNSGSDTSESLTATTGINTINEKINSVTTNKQYAYEIKAFLETAESLIAFKKWENNFYWIEGII